MKRWMMGAALAAVAINIPAPLLAADYAVVVANSNPVESMSKEDVQRHFLKNPIRRWDGGEKIVPVDLVNNEKQKAELISDFFNMTLDEYKRYWASQRYVTGDRPPKEVDDDDAADFFADNDGAIGVIAASKVTPALKEAAKVVYQSGN